MKISFASIINFAVKNMNWLKIHFYKAYTWLFVAHLDSHADYNPDPLHCSQDKEALHDQAEGCHNLAHAFESHQHKIQSIQTKFARPPKHHWLQNIILCL